MFEGTAPGAYSILIHAYDERLCATPAYGLRDGCEKIGPGPSLPCELSTGPTWHLPRGRHLIISSLLLLLQSPPSSHQQHQHQHHHHHLTITITTVIDSDRLTVDIFWLQKWLGSKSEAASVMSWISLATSCSGVCHRGRNRAMVFLTSKHIQTMWIMDDYGFKISPNLYMIVVSVDTN